MYYVYKIEWSQTDNEYVIFYSENCRPDSVLKANWPNARYYTFICKDVFIVR